MKKILICLAALFAATVFFSCERTIEQEQITPEPSVTHTFTLSVPATKIATRALSLEGKTLNASWDEYDCVTGMYGGTAILLTPVNPGDATTTLTGEFDMENHPLQEGDEIELLFTGHNNSKLTNLSYAWQAGTLEDIAASYDYATATVSVESIDEAAGTLTTTAADFENQQAIVKFTLKDANGDPLTDVVSLRISVASGKLVGCYSDDPQGPMYEDIVVGSADSPIGSNEVWVALRNESGAADTYILEATTANGDVYTYQRPNVTFAYGSFYMIGVKMTKQESSGWFVVGGFNGWNTSATEMTAVLDHEGWLVARDVNLTPQSGQDGGFKFYNNGNNGTWKGGNMTALHTQYEASGDGNISFREDTFDIYYNPTTNKFFLANAREPWIYKTIHLMCDMELTDATYYLHLWPHSGTGVSTTWPGIVGSSETISGIPYYKFGVAICDGDFTSNTYDCIFHTSDDAVRYDFRDGALAADAVNTDYYASFTGKEYSKGVDGTTFGETISNPMTQFTDPAKPEGESYWAILSNDHLTRMHWNSGPELVVENYVIGPETEMKLNFNWKWVFFGPSTNPVDANIDFAVSRNNTGVFSVDLDVNYLCDVYLNIFNKTARIVAKAKSDAEITLYFGVPNPGTYVNYYTFNGKSMAWPGVAITDNYVTISGVNFYKAVVSGAEFWDSSINLIVVSDGISNSQTHDFTTADWSGYKDEYWFYVNGRDLIQLPGNPTNVSINVDGNMSDWIFIDPLASTGTNRIRSWKFVSDEDNLYFYLVLRKNKMRTAYNLTLVFDWDDSGSYSGDNLSGGEASVVFQPFTNADAGTPVVDTNTINAATINGSAVSNAGIKARGYDPDSSATGDGADYYLEVSIPKTSVPGLPASGSINIGAGYEWFNTGLQSVTL